MPERKDVLRHETIMVACQRNTEANPKEFSMTKPRYKLIPAFIPAWTPKRLK